MSSLKNKHILLVEDDEILREVLQEEFLSNEALVETVLSGNQAIKKIKECPEPFDLIVTDVQMPDGDGPFILDKVQEMKLDKKPAILMISGYSDLPTEELIKKGANYVLTKPFELEELISKSIILIEENESKANQKK